jgi:NAD(P)H-hydrate epimerase
MNEAVAREMLEYDAIVYGMGMGISEEVAKGAVYLLQNYQGKLIIDADGLNSLARYGEIDALKGAKCEVLLTPHIKEFSRISGLSLEEIVEAGLYAPCAFAKKYGVSVLLKNAVSILTDGERTLVNTTGTAGQAKGGSGDVLAGVIGGLCGGGLSVFDGGTVGSYLTGRSAELLKETHGDYSLLASDVVGGLGKAFLDLFAENADDEGDDE